MDDYRVFWHCLSSYTCAYGNEITRYGLVVCKSTQFVACLMEWSDHVPDVPYKDYPYPIWGIFEDVVVVFNGVELVRYRMRDMPPPTPITYKPLFAAQGFRLEPTDEFLAKLKERPPYEVVATMVPKKVARYDPGVLHEGRLYGNPAWAKDRRGIVMADADFIYYVGKTTRKIAYTGDPDLIQFKLSRKGVHVKHLHITGYSERISKSSMD